MAGRGSARHGERRQGMNSNEAEVTKTCVIAVAVIVALIVIGYNLTQIVEAWPSCV